MRKPTDDFTIDHLRPHERVIARAVLAALPPDATGGGCRAFDRPDSVHGRPYGGGSLLIVNHDGGSLAPLCNWDYGDARGVERLRRSLEKAGLYIQACTTTYSAIYLA